MQEAPLLLIGKVSIDFYTSRWAGDTQLAKVWFHLWSGIETSFEISCKAFYSYLCWDVILRLVFPKLHVVFFATTRRLIFQIQELVRMFRFKLTVEPRQNRHVILRSKHAMTGRNWMGRGQPGGMVHVWRHVKVLRGKAN